MVFLRCLGVALPVKLFVNHVFLGAKVRGVFCVLGVRTANEAPTQAEFSDQTISVSFES